MTVQPIAAYFLRHGATAGSPHPEKWKPIPLSDNGRQQAIDGALHLHKLTMQGWEPPDRVISSDLPRAKQTADIAAQAFGIPSVTTDSNLRAFNDEAESPADYELRSEQALGAAINGPGRPLIVGHRSMTSFLDKRFHHGDDPDFEPDYLNYALVREGGALGIRNPHGLVPLWSPIEEHWPKG